MPEFAELLRGYDRFRGRSYAMQKSRYDQLSSDGQHPPVMIISCCDSRVDPSNIFDTVPGQVFALRNVANLVPPYQPDANLHGTSAAIEFAVLGLDVRHIVVMGHGQCGGIQASLSGHDLGEKGPSFIDNWMSLISGAREQVLRTGYDDPQRALELAAIKVSITNLRTFPYVRSREETGMLKLHGCFFAISDGVLHVLDETSGEFAPA